MGTGYQGATYNNLGELVDQNGNPISKDEASAQTFPTVPPGVKVDVNSTDDTLNAFAQNSQKIPPVTTNDDNTYGGVRHNAKGTGYVMDIDGVETPVDKDGNVLSAEEIDEVPETVAYDPEKDPLVIAANKKKEEEKLEDPADEEDKTSLLDIANKDISTDDDPGGNPDWVQKILDAIGGKKKTGDDDDDPDGEKEDEPEGPDIKAMGQAFMKMGEDIKKPNYEWSGDDIF